jgi:hypothetical protein
MKWGEKGKMMEDDQILFLNPDGPNLPDFSVDPHSIEIQRMGGEVIKIDPQPGRVRVDIERPQVERMDGDWGAICEVFKQSQYYYATIQGVQLSVGDVITLRYPNRSEPVNLTVIDKENGRAQVNLPLAPKNRK